MSMSQPPPPPGLDVNANASPSALAAEIVTRCLGFLAIFLRFLARRVGHTDCWWDDWFVLVAGIFMVPAMYLEISITQMGVGRHIWWVVQYNANELPGMTKRLFADELFYIPIIALCKLSILCLYVRIFGVSKKFAIACYAQMGMVVVWALITLFLYIFQCSPVWVAWSPMKAGGACINFTNLFLGTNTVNVLMDFAILLTPMHCIWTLRLSFQRKLLISGVLFLGGGEVILSMIRVIQLSRLEHSDPTWDEATTMIWSTIEVDVAALCACLPCLGPLLPRACFGRTSSSGTSRTNKYDTYDSNHSSSNWAGGRYGNKAHRHSQYGEMGTNAAAYGGAYHTPPLESADENSTSDRDEYHQPRNKHAITIQHTTSVTVQGPQRDSKPPPPPKDLPSRSWLP